MFTDSKKAAKWWGPEGWVNLAFELDPRPGGAMRIEDRDPDGTVFRTTGKILELIVPERLVYKSSTTIGNRAAPFEAVQTVTFEEIGPGRTRVTAIVDVRAVGSWSGDILSLAEGFKGGWGESFDRLQRELTAGGNSTLRISEQSTVMITRVFEAPRETVFSMWTDPKKLARWWGPEGHMNALCEIDPRPGGMLKITDQAPDGTTYPLTGTFEKVVAPELIVFKTVSPGFVGWSPWEALNTVTFEELGPRRTRMNVEVKVLKVVPNEAERLEQGFKAGWGESLDKLQRELG